MSAETHYVDIICLDSCGEASRAHRHSWNQVYTRSENVAGAKTSDDTLSALADALLGDQRPGFSQPLLYRPRWVESGKIDSTWKACILIVFAYRRMLFLVLATLAWRCTISSFHRLLLLAPNGDACARHSRYAYFESTTPLNGGWRREVPRRCSCSCAL